MRAKLYIFIWPLLKILQIKISNFQSKKNGNNKVFDFTVYLTQIGVNIVFPKSLSGWFWFEVKPFKCILQQIKEGKIQSDWKLNSENIRLGTWIIRWGKEYARKKKELSKSSCAYIYKGHVFFATLDEHFWLDESIKCLRD